MQRDVDNVYFPFIEVKLSDGTLLTWNGNAPDYFTSLTHTRYVDKANTAIINITVAIGPNDDPDKIEKILIENGECTFQYGYAGRKSRVYKGMITGYTPSFSEGVISYTINLVSKAVTYNGTKMTGMKYQIKNNRLSDGNSGGIMNAIASGLSTVGGIFNNAKIINIIEQIVNRYMPGYVFDKENSDVDFNVPNITIDCEGKNPVKALQDIVRLLHSSGSDTDKSLISYKVVIEDNVGVGKDGVVKIKKKGGDREQADINYEFVWGSKDCDVINWSPKYNGAALLFKDNKNTAEVSGTPQIDEQKVDIAVFEQPPVADDYEDIDRWKNNWNEGELYQKTLEDTANFCEHCNYPYEAEITVLGLSDEDVRLCDTYVSVLPMVGGGRAHHSKGVYQVIGIVDTVNSSGFTTKLSLIRHVEQSKIYIAGEQQFIYDKNGNKVNLYTYEPNYTTGDPTNMSMTSATSVVSTRSQFSGGSGSAATVIDNGSYHNATVVWNALAKSELGLSDILIAGIMGNLMAETGGNTLNIDPSLVGDNGHSYGIAQWYDNPNVNATNRRTIEEQAEYLADSSSFIGQFLSRGSFETFMSSNDVTEAARNFCNLYERPADWVSREQRIQNAHAAYDWYVSIYQSGGASNKKTQPGYGPTPQVM